VNTATRSSPLHKSLSGLASRLNEVGSGLAICDRGS
jgi:hypothetical protein